MSTLRAHSSPQLLHSNNFEQEKDFPLEACKLIQAHVDASKEDDGKNQQRIAGTVTILDEVKSTIQKTKAELRRCNTDLRRGGPVKDGRKPQDPVAEENQKLHRALAASMAARKSLEKMFSSLGKEKEIIAAELAKKVREVNDTEELIGDLRAQNDKLLDKVKACATEHRAKKGGANGVVGGDAQGQAALQERNKLLSEQLLKSLDSYRSTKRRLKESQEENTRITYKISEVAGEVTSAVDKVHGIRQGITGASEEVVRIKEELSELEDLLLLVKKKLGKCNLNKVDGVKPQL